jgi:hypothetical protein
MLAMVRDICDIFNMKHIVQKATCFTKIAKATLLDLILTCQECDFKKVCNFGTGISNVHNFIAAQLNCDLPKIFPKKKLCRSFKNFDVTINTEFIYGTCFGKIFLSLKGACLSATSLKHLLK